jgi:transcriptional regulator GlxA family with amidase domain
VAAIAITRRGFLGAAAALALLGATGCRGTAMSGGTTIAIGIWDGVEELDVVGPYEVLSSWAAFSDRPLEVVTVSDRRALVRCGHGLALTPDTTWSALGRPDVLVMPGGGSGGQLRDERLLRRLRSFASDGTLMTSVCTGAVVYAAAGLLDGKPATTHWSAMELLAQTGKNVEVRPDARFVDAGDVITSAGVSAGIDMSLYLIARLESDERAREVRRYIQYDPAPPA